MAPPGSSTKSPPWGPHHRGDVPRVPPGEWAGLGGGRWQRSHDKALRVSTGKARGAAAPAPRGLAGGIWARGRQEPLGLGLLGAQCHLRVRSGAGGGPKGCLKTRLGVELSLVLKERRVEGQREQGKRGREEEEAEECRAPPKRSFKTK